MVPSFVMSPTRPPTKPQRAAGDVDTETGGQGLRSELRGNHHNSSKTRPSIASQSPKTSRKLWNFQKVNEESEAQSWIRGLAESQCCVDSPGCMGEVRLLDSQWLVGISWNVR
jgi:hypothetical protein